MVSHTNTTRRNDALLALNSIRRLVQALRVFDSQAQGRAGLSGAQVFVLYQLRDGRAISINELAERTCTDQSSASVVAQRLVDRKFARHQKSKTDGRRVELSITPAGRRILRAAPRAAQERIIGAFHKMSATRRRQLAECLEEWVRRIGLDRRPPALFFENSTTSRKRTRMQRERK